MKKIMVCLLSFGLVFSAISCGGKGNVSVQEGDGDPFGKYENELSLNLVTTSDVTVSSQVLAYYPQESISENRFTRLYKDELNVKINYKWVASSADDYATKLDMAMAVRDLPDAFIVDTSTLSELVEAGQIRDMTDAWKNYASPLLKEITEKEGDAVFQAATYDGKLYGIPQIYSSIDRAQMVWIRMDWIQKLNSASSTADFPELPLHLPTNPSTLEELRTIISAFKKYSKILSGRDPSKAFGLSIQGDIWNSMGGITPLMNMYEAYPNIWYQKEDKLVYGSIQPEVKEALSALAEMYQTGEIATDFVTKSTTGISDDVTMSKAGVVFGEQWLCSYPIQQLYDMDNQADWKAFSVFSNQGKQSKAQVTMGTYGWWVASNSLASPEVIVKCMNTYVEHIWGSKADVDTYYMPSDTGAAIWKLSPFQPEPPTKNLDCYQAIKKAKENNDFSLLTGEALQIYNNIASFQNGQKSLWSWMRGYWPDENNAVYETMNDYVENDRILYNAFSGAPTKNMKKNSQMELFSAKQGELYTAAINGTKTVDAAYRELLAYWNTMNGSLIEGEVNNWYNERN